MFLIFNGGKHIRLEQNFTLHLTGNVSLFFCAIAKKIGTRKS